ncbi:MAG: flagellar hook-length control protein FliK [Alphaproteobacteria bacterium]|nr:MAG: flagellar hook-length control protein FliK [Alphaproteobacteria bacterium]
MMVAPSVKSQRDNDGKIPARSQENKVQPSAVREQESTNTDIDAENKAQEQRFSEVLDAQNTPKKEDEPSTTSTSDVKIEDAAQLKDSIAQKKLVESQAYFQHCAVMCSEDILETTDIEVIPLGAINIAGQEAYAAAVAFIPQILPYDVPVQPIVDAQISIVPALMVQEDGTDVNLDSIMDVQPLPLHVHESVAIMPEIAVDGAPIMVETTLSTDMPILVPAPIETVELQALTSPEAQAVATIQHPVRSLMQRWMDLMQTTNLAPAAPTQDSALEMPALTMPIDAGTTAIIHGADTGVPIDLDPSMTIDELFPQVQEMLEDIMRAMESPMENSEGLMEAPEMGSERIIHSRDFLSFRDDGVKLVTHRDHTPILRPVQLVVMQMSQQRHAVGGEQKITLQLYPEELGRVDVDMRIDTDNRAVVRISADRGETLDILRADRSELERLLQQSGLKLDGQSLEFNQRASHEQQDEQSSAYAGGMDDRASSEIVNEAEEIMITTQEGIWLMSGVNIRV